MKKAPFFAVRLTLAAGLVAIYVYVINSLEYWSQLKYADNLIGAAPMILISGIAGLLMALIWKRYKNAATSTMVLSILLALWGLLLIPAISGNWYPLAKIQDYGSASPDMTIYDPFTNDTQVAKLPQKASIAIMGELPILDGATALYPVYSAFANAVYNKADYSRDVVVCTNTSNAYRSIVSGECDVIFAAQPSEKQIQAAKAAGADLIFTPIGREAFVFLVGKSNPIDELSYQQLKNIYSGKTSNWETLGWNDGGGIIAFQRPEGSGSQTGLQGMMGSLPILKPRPLPDDSLIGTGSLMKQVSVEWGGVQPAIGYSYRYYAVTMYPNPDAKILRINGVYPSSESISNESYPFTASFYAVTNGQPTGNVKLLLDWILSDEGQYLIEQTGYAPIS